jgi:hypothetical protein
MVIDSRGSGENRIVNGNLVPEVSPPGAYFAPKFRHQHPSATLAVVSNPYPAVSIFRLAPDGWRQILNGLGALLHFARVGAYHDSVVAGKKWLAHEMATASTRNSAGWRVAGTQSSQLPGQKAKRPLEIVVR